MLHVPKFYKFMLDIYLYLSTVHIPHNLRVSLYLQRIIHTDNIDK